MTTGIEMFSFFGWHWVIGVSLLRASNSTFERFHLELLIGWSLEKYDATTTSSRTPKQLHQWMSRISQLLYWPGALAQGGGTLWNATRVFHAMWKYVENSTFFEHVNFASPFIGWKWKVVCKLQLFCVVKSKKLGALLSNYYTKSFLPFDDFDSSSSPYE